MAPLQQNDSLFDGQGMRARDGVAIKECQELAKSIEEGPVGEQADALVGVDGAGAGSDVAGGFVWTWALQS